jgi:hypothetical protein
MLNTPQRGTGRTAQMLHEIVAASKDGELVGIASHSYEYSRYLCRMAEKMGAQRGRVIPMSPNGSSHLAVDRMFRDHSVEQS